MRSATIHRNDDIGKVMHVIDQGLISKGDAILEVGAGPGNVHRFCTAKGYRVTSTDLVESKNVSRLDIEKETITGHYDVIMGFAVLHHLKQPKETLAKLQKSAERLIFVEPYRKSIIHLLIALQPKEWSRWRFFRHHFPGKIIRLKGQSIDLRIPQLLIVWTRGKGFETG